jgi:uncharacterized protein YhfF
VTESQQTQIDAFWEAFLQSGTARLPPDAPYIEADAFGNTPEMGDELAALVCDGVKTATSGLLWGYEALNERLPEPGDIAIVLDGNGVPACIIELIETRIMPFDMVDEQLAWEYGEGDRTLAWWREHLWDYYVADCARSGWQPSPDMPLVVKRFQTIYP